MLAEQTAHTLQAVDRVLLATADQVRNENIGSPAAFRAAQDDVRLRVVLAEQLKALPQAMALALVDADGKLVAASSSWPAAWRDVSDRDYIRTLLADRATEISIGAAERSGAATTG